MPIPQQTRMPTAAQNQGKTSEALSSSAMPLPAPTPRRMPSNPPMTEIATASMRNWVRMLALRAPMDLRTPISFVRSVTLTSMMFMMPTPAASNAMALMTNAPAPMTSATLANAEMSESFE